MTLSAIKIVISTRSIKENQKDFVVFHIIVLLVVIIFVRKGAKITTIFLLISLKFCSTLSLLHSHPIPINTN